MNRAFILIILMCFLSGCINSKRTHSVTGPLKKIRDDLAWFIFDDEDEFTIE